MRKSSPRPKSLRPTLSWLLCFFLVVSAILAPYEATYAAYDGVRPNSFSDNICDTTNGDKGKKFIDYDPVGLNGTNFDFQIEFTNPTCLAFIAASGTAMYVANKAATAMCQASIYPPNTASALPNTAIQATDVPYPNPTLPLRVASSIRTCAQMAVNTAAAIASCTASGGTTCPSVPISTTDQVRCCSSIAVHLAAIAAMYAALAIIHGLANQAYHTGKICGSEWYGWEQLNSNGEQDDSGIWTKVKGPHQKCLINVFNKTSLSNADGCERGVDEDKTSVGNKNYREYIYGGVEKTDNSSDACTNPTTWSAERKNRILGYDTKEQRYYMTGPGMAPSYACYRFLAKATAEGGNTVEQDQSAMQESYDCCKSRSQNAVCIESEAGSRDINNKVTSPNGVSGYDNPVEVNDDNDSELEKNWYNNSRHKFCTIGSKCENNGIFFEAYASTKEVNYACVKTYSTCPYNHLLGGGTEKKKESGGNLENFCQFMKHCSKLPVLPYVGTSNLTGAFIDSSCRDMKGDSQNYFSYQAELLQSKTTGFTAPIVQCFKETMENIFLNKAGYTECLDPDEIPDDNEYCSTGYRLREGFAVSGDSFFIKLQKKFQTLIKIVLTISVTFYGVMILLAVPKSYIERKNLFPYVLKLALVCYFTMGTAWQDILISGVLEASGTLAAITFKPDNSQETSKLDGCQFPRWNYADDDDSTKYDNPSYPPGKEYLEVWDILDCKIAKAIGFGPSLSVPNLIFMILGGFFTGGLGIVFVVAAFIFAFFLIFMAIRALQFFLVAMTSVIILMYISVFIIPLCLFNRTKEIFNKWWKNMLGFILQPMILFAYLGILIAIFDNIVIGSATFTTTGTITIDGNENSRDDYGQASEKTISCNSKAEDDSIYCIFRIADIKTYNGFEALGVGLPILGSMNASKLITIIKGALLMYIFSTFMDKIAEVAASLVGGSQIKDSSWSNSFKPHEMAMKAGSALQGVQSRGMAATRAAAGSALRKGGELAGKAANRGKSKVEATEKGGSDSSINSRTDTDTGSDSAINSRTDTDTGSDSSIKSRENTETGSDSPSKESELAGGGGEKNSSSASADKETRDTGSNPEASTPPATPDKDIAPEASASKNDDLDSSSAGKDKEEGDTGSNSSWNLMDLASRAYEAVKEAATEVAETAAGAATEVAETAAGAATEVAGAAQKAGADIYSAAMGGAADTNSSASTSADASTSGVAPSASASTSGVAPSASASASEVAPPPSASAPSSASASEVAPPAPPPAAPAANKSDVAPKSKGQGGSQSRYIFSTKEGGKPSSVKSNAPSTSSTSSGGSAPRENNSSRLRKEATDNKNKKK
jgi:type IV secretory pathway VirB6-like protein